MFGDQDELEAFNNQKADKGLEEDNMWVCLVKFNMFRSFSAISNIFILSRSTDEIVRPRVPLEACLATFSSPEQIRDYYSTALKGKTTAIKYGVFFFLSESYHNSRLEWIQTNILRVKFCAGQLVWHLSQIIWCCTCGSLLWRQAGCQRNLVSFWNSNPFNIPSLAFYIKMLIFSSSSSWFGGDRCVHWCSGCNWYQPHAQQRASAWRGTIGRRWCVVILICNNGASPNSPE